MEKEKPCKACDTAEGIRIFLILGYVAFWLLLSGGILITADFLVGVPVVGFVLLVFHIVGIPIYSGLIDGKLHQHLRLDSVVRDDKGKQVLRFDRPVILKFIGGILRRDRLIDPTVFTYWKVVRTGIGPSSFVLRETWGDKRSIRAPLTEYLTVWLKRTGVNDQGPLNLALANIEYMLAGITALKQRIEESRTGKPKHTCPIAAPIKEQLDRIAHTPNDETRRGSGMTVADMVNSWLDHMPSLVMPKAPARKTPGNTLEQT